MRQRDAFSFARELTEIESFLGGDKHLSATVVATRARCDEITSARDEHETVLGGADTERDETSLVSNGDLLTRYAAGCDEGGGGRCDGIVP